MPDAAAHNLLAWLRERGEKAHAETLAALLDDHAALARAKKAAEAANEAKTRFLASVSHEIRSPLNAICGYAQLLERGDGRDTVQAGKVIRRSAEHLSNLVEGLLDIAQVESGSLKLARDTICFPAFLEQLAAMFEPQAAMKGLALNLDLPPTLPEFVRADPKRLRQVLINLLSNAIKFTDTGSVTLRVHYRNELATFEVVDSGIGIAPADIERILLPFERAGAAAARSGIGLGLAITQALVTIMGGELRIESKPDEGSRFIVRLMLSQPLSPPVDLRGHEATSLYLGRERRVLLIDDDPAHRAALCALLIPRGFAVLTAEGGADGLAIAASEQPDLVLLDVSMPGMSGWDIAATLRRRHGAALRIVMLSGEIADSAEGGEVADRFVPKPFDFDQLLAVISEELSLEWPRTAQTRPGLTTLPARIGAEAQPHLAEIARLVRIGHVRAIEAQIDALAALGPDTATLAERMRAHLDAFDLKALAALAAGEGER
ncbi:ATP-binding response regulator [Erythrobacter tepidarius]|uniref:ATP-binding response regulator n=1 Tax=Erythrobacter tepidarius TaxID=60454 RepID=UPI000A35DAC9|nr:ATP-binding protein [Erythrobacter tepidarius]